MAYPLLMRLVRIAFRKRLRIELTRDSVRVRKFLRWRTYNRQIAHRFCLVPHRLTQKEQLRHQQAIQQAARRGQTVSRRSYYAESFHLIFEYLGHAHEITAIYGQERAMAVLARLKACDEKLNIDTGNNDGIALEPEEQWSGQPGDIPEKG